MIMRAFTNPIRSQRLELLRRWERGELTDQQLLTVMWAMRAREGRFQECANGRELAGSWRVPPATFVHPLFPMRGMER